MSTAKFRKVYGKNGSGRFVVEPYNPNLICVNLIPFTQEQEQQWKATMEWMMAYGYEPEEAVCADHE